MLEEMEGDLATAKKDEATAATGFEELSAAKAAEIASATSAIESKTKRSGEVAVEVVQTQDDMEDTEAEVKETQAFIGDLAKQCAEKKADWAERQKMRAEEISAISEAIKVLNDDDASATCFYALVHYISEFSEYHKTMQRVALCCVHCRRHTARTSTND